MASHPQEFSSNQSHNLQEDSPELDQRIAQSGRNNIIQNISNFRIDGADATFSDLEINQIILDIRTKIIKALDQLDEISGNINAIASYWKIPDTASELRDLRKDIDFYKKTLDSYNSKLTKIKSSSENLYLLLQRMLGIKIPQMSEIRFPQKISLTRVMIESIQSNVSQPGESMAVLIIWELGKHFATCKFYEKQFVSAGCQIASIAYKIGLTVYNEYKSQSDAEGKISEIKIEFIRCALKEKLVRINKFFERAIAESEGNLKTAMDQSLMQVREAIKMEKESHPDKSEIDIVMEMRKITFCAGLILPLKNALNCSSHLVWELILEQFRRPRSHSAVEAHTQTL